ncbi:hypothetical protein ACPA9J_27610 [Pseudomonas aeruginosa]
MTVKSGVLEVDHNAEIQAGYFDLIGTRWPRVELQLPERTLHQVRRLTHARSISRRRLRGRRARAPRVDCWGLTGWRVMSSTACPCSPAPGR